VKIKGVPTLADLAAALGGTSNGYNVSAYCPVCDYGKPLLSATVKGGRLLIHCHAGCPQNKVFAAVAKILGSGKRGAGPARRPPTSEWRQDGLPSSYGIAQSQALTAAREVWEKGVPVADHPVARAYLERRNCVLPHPTGPLRAVDAAYHPMTRTTWPALVALVIGGPLKKVITTHTTFLAPDGSGKAPVTPNRLFAAGLCSKGFVRLTDDYVVSTYPTEVGVAEGIETALSLAHAVPHVWACLNAGNLQDLPVPALREIYTLTIAVDRDVAGERAAAACARRWHAAGVKVRLVKPASGDVNDLISDGNNNG
jgi:putative DNA primase/helicase